MKKLLISAALGATLIAGGIAVAQPGGAAGPAPRGPMMADANKDGVLTRAEATAGAEALFAKRDANGDGKITKEDRAALRQQRLDARFARLDTDKNGQISKAEFQAKREGGERGKRWGHGGRGHGGKAGWALRGADANKDGALTRAEFVARGQAMFDRVDADKDGKVTAAEMQAARPHHGKHGRSGGAGAGNN